MPPNSKPLPTGTSGFTPETPEKRSFTRGPVELRVEYRRLNGLFADYTHNISQGGIFIQTNEPLPPGTSLHFSLLAPTMETPLVLKGQVAWTRSKARATAAAPAGMGIEFQFAPGERVALQSKIEDLMVASLGPQLAKQLLGRKSRPS